jgi:hypothetical protein
VITDAAFAASLDQRMFLPRTASSDDDSEGRTIWIADAHRGDGRRFVVRADEKLAAFVELEAEICARSQPLAAQRLVRGFLYPIPNTLFHLDG